MEFTYCFSNASLTQRLSHYLHSRMSVCPVCTTVIFLNDCWVTRVILPLTATVEHQQHCLAMLGENGIVHQSSARLRAAFDALDQGCSITTVMNTYQIAIVSHGAPAPEEIHYFQEQFVTGLGYRPQSLV